MTQEQINSLNEVVGICHQNSVNGGWWNEPDSVFTVPTKLALIHSEISEAMEGDRKDSMDDKLPQYPQLDTELADAVIRIFDLAGRKGMNLGQIIHDKMEFNKVREDHKAENRAKTGGKKY